MAGLSNCIYRAYSSSKFIMKSLLRFPTVEPWGEKCNPCLCYERCWGESHSRAPIEYLQNFTTSQCLLENLSKSYLHCLFQTGAACKLYQIYSLPWPLMLRKSTKLGEYVIIAIFTHLKLLILYENFLQPNFKLNFCSVRFFRIKFQRITSLYSTCKIFKVLNKLQKNRATLIKMQTRELINQMECLIIIHLCIQELR